MFSMANRSRFASVGVMGVPFWRGFVDIGREEYDRGQYDFEGFEPFAFCGGAALIKRDIFRELGGFDGRFFLYVEDVDFSWRIRLSGYSVGFAPRARVAHHLSVSNKSKPMDAQKLYYRHRNLLRAILKNCGPSLGWAVRNYFLFSLIIAVAFCILEPRKAIAIARAISWNLFNFRDTYAQRLRIQGSRTKTETDILTRMYPRLNRYQPAQHLELRHILDILFQYSQSLPSSG